ncbi:phosphatase PAP2 family protein [Petropleomorpha daqingensis]|uniref:Undecaprenyl-diphosphatase n=1 Tax=Petropleomorpha daqingensis TaxID=2026353 RepID=A0A853CH22_9ACTN|nr:phosphatase PAP2 family protein [Petropleomorpha daqingensis]NYJ06289.1 undecaprenyl-diphosphatase [Petropleomorpha daqingensis]
MTRSVPRQEPRLLPPQLRRPALVVLVLCAALVTALGVRYHDDARAGRLDARVYSELSDATGAYHQLLGGLATAVPVLVTAVALVLAALCAAARRWRAAALAIAAPGLTTLVVESAKHVVDRTIHGGLAYPSGHTAGAASVLVVAGLLVLSRRRGQVVAAAVALFLTALAGAGVVGLVMVSIHAHYATDTVAGFGTAVVVTLGLAFGLDALPLRGHVASTAPL